VRVINHGMWAALGGVTGVLLATMLVGREAFAWIVATTIVAIVSAALWAQVVEGSPQLLRPFGYFGSVLGVALVGVMAIANGRDGWLLLASMGTGGCLTVAFGRMRCLVQGCCHGREVHASWGIHYTHPRSRVVRLGALGGVALHPAPLYSALWALVSCAVLVRLWFLSAPLPFIAGVSLLLAGLGRFVEEHFRGEPQTAQVAGLRLYQWLAIALVLAGALMTCVAGASAPAPTPLSVGHVPAVLLLFAFIAAAYGVDFPESGVRFSRLA
jgi:prolipoprotein diacylglyceryltransferase